MNQKIKSFCDHLLLSFDEISEERKVILNRLSEAIEQSINQHGKVKLIYVCTHNSRRSHFGQIWSKVAATYFNIDVVETFSGGTEATAFNPNAIEALRSQGFEITTNEMNSHNPVYLVDFGINEKIVCFSKVYDYEVNPKSDFIAVMTCSDAEENCPFIPGVSYRIATTYEDPKKFDDTPLQEVKYLERSRQIALECMYVLSKIKNNE
jgi:protein-tyrosine phosphatase/arsenate reductase